MVRGIEDLTKAVAEGKIDLEDFNTRWQSINDTFQNTGDIDQYNKSINELAKELEKATGVEAGKWVEGLNQQFEGLSYADAKLNKFLQSYNSSLDQLRNGDSIAINLKKQFEELTRFSDLIDSEFIATGKIDVELLAEVKESESFKYLPQQIQTAIDGIISDNKVTEAEQDILLRLKTIIQNEGALDDDVSEQLNRLFQGKSTQQELEIGIKIGDYHIPPDLMKILNSEYEGKNTEINFKINTENIEKLDEITQKRDELNGSITESTHKVKTEGTEELEKTNEMHDGSNGKITESTHKINSEGAEEVKNDIAEINQSKKELEKPTNLSINKGELQGSVDEFNKLIEYSTKLKDGEYQISFKSDTADAIAQIENLKLAVNNLSNQFMQIPSTTITLNTSLAAKNLSGLIVRINQTKEALGNLSSKNVNINTAQSAKNLSGLITRVNEYKAAADNAKTATFNAETAQAAKNMSGLISKINATNTAAGSTKTINFKTNATSVANQVKSLASAVKSVPNGKTITYSIKTNGSVPKVSSPRSVFAMEGQGESLASVASYDATSVDSESLMSARASSSEMLVSANPVASPMLRKISSTDAKNMFDYDVDIFKKLENSLKKISNELDIISKKSENAFGQEKINYLQKQIELLKQQQQLQHSLAEDMRVQQDVLKKYLLGKGFTFDAEDNISNYSQKLLAYEKYVKSLENKANSNKNNDKIQAQYDGAKKDLDEIKNALNSYLDLTFSKIPNASKEWWDMEESIKDCVSEIEQLKISLKNIDASINIGKYEGTLNKVQREINRLDEDIERAFGKRKEELIQKKIELIRQEQQELHKLANSYRDQARTYGEYLSGFGFKFDSSGMITNLENIKNLTNDARYEVIKEALEEYINLTQSKIPNLSEEWWDLQDSIESSKDKIEEARKELEKFIKEAKIDALLDQFNDLAHRLDIIDKKLKHATGKDKLDLMSEKLEIIKQQQIELQKHWEFFNNQKNTLQMELGQLGFKFDNDGDITNYVEQLEILANSSSDFEEVKEKLEEYFDLQNNRLPDIESDWLDLENAYKDALKEQLNTTKEIEDKITEMYKKQINDRIDAMNKETDEKVKNLKKQQEAYNKYREEANYKDEYEDKLSNINDIQRQLDIAMRDTSLQGQKKVKELQKLLADAQKDLDKLTQDKIDSDVNDAFEAETDRITESNKNTIEQLEKEWSDSKIAEMVSQAISSGIFEGIDGEISNLQDAMLEFAESTGELFGVMGTVIKSELITNLGIAMEAFRDLDNILKGLDLDKFATLSNTVKLDLSAANVSPAKSSNVEFNAPLINIEGNVNNDVMEDLKTYQDQLTKDIIKQISSSIR